MDFSLISNTFITIFTTDVFFYCILGVVAGMVIGTLPGLSATMGIASDSPHLLAGTRAGHGCAAGHL